MASTITCPCCQQGWLGPSVTIPDLQFFWGCDECEAVWFDLRNLSYGAGTENVTWTADKGYYLLKGEKGIWGQNILPLDPEYFSRWNRSGAYSRINGVRKLTESWASQIPHIEALDDPKDRAEAMEAWRRNLSPLPNPKT